MILEAKFVKESDCVQSREVWSRNLTVVIAEDITVSIGEVWTWHFEVKMSDCEKLEYSSVFLFG